MNQELPKTVTVDGREYAVADLGPQVGTLIQIHTTWRNDLQAARLEVAKLEAALRSLEAEMLSSIKAHLAKKEEGTEGSLSL